MIRFYMKNNYCEILYFRNYLIENISLIINFKIKYYHGYMTSLKYIYLKHISLAIIHTTIVDYIIIILLVQLRCSFMLASSVLSSTSI